MHPPFMKKFLSHCLLIIFVLSLNLSCSTVYRSHSLYYKNYQINEAVQKDSSLLALMQPYEDSVNHTMNEVIGFVELSLIKKKPEGTLGNFMADAYFIMAGEKFNMKIDAAFMNDGGIRLDELAAGPLTRGKIFELMPFDNILIIQKIKGTVLQEFLDLTATQRGWPVAGITMQIKDKKAINVFIDGQPLDTNKIYTTVNSDFIANGGNNADMLKPISQINNGYLVRDALFDYIKKLERQGKKISAKIENRVTHVQ